MQNKSLVLIDAYSQIFRSYYAIRKLTNRRGEPINAAFVFTKLLLLLDKKYPSDYGAMLFDCGKVASRLTLNPEYKANRPPMPDDLRRQIPLIRKISEAFGWQLLQHEEFEADDLIGGMAKKHTDFQVSIVSSDKDLSQLINDRIIMLIPVSGGFEPRTVKDVTAKFGVAPEEIVDYLSLIGDSADNIPGVPGIGPKSAAEIIHSFGKIEQWIDHPEKLPADNKHVKKLLPSLEILQKNRQLIRLKTELPDKLNTAMPPERKTPDWELIREICVDNSFKSILKDIPEPAAEMPAFEEEDDLFAFAAAAAKKDVITPETEKKEIQDELF